MTDVPTPAMLEINAVRIENYRAFPAEGSWIDDLGRLNLVFGPNNSGKSTFLQAISTICHSDGSSDQFPYQGHHYNGSPDAAGPRIRLRMSGLGHSVVHFLCNGTGRDSNDLISRSPETLLFPEPLEVSIEPRPRDVDTKGTQWKRKYHIPPKALERYTERLSKLIVGGLTQEKVSESIKQALGAAIRRLVHLPFPGDRRVSHGSEVVRDSSESFWPGLFANPNFLAALGEGRTFNETVRLARQSLYPLSDVFHRKLPIALQTIFGGDARDFRIELKQSPNSPPPDTRFAPEIHLRTSGSQLVPMSHMGGGYRNVFHILCSILIADEMLFIERSKSEGHEQRTILISIEEPENDLHPAIHSRFLEGIAQLPLRNKVQIFVTSQSLGLLRSQLPARKLRTIQGPTASVVAAEVEDIPSTFADLGYEAEKLFLAEKILFVEGPTEQPIFLRMIELLGGDPNDFILWPLHGTGARPYAEDLSPLTRLSEHRRAVGLVLDSEVGGPGQEVERWRVELVHRFQQECGPALVLQAARAVENLVAPHVVERAYGFEFNNDFWGPYERSLTRAATAATGDPRAICGKKPQIGRRLASHIESLEDFQFADDVLELIRSLIRC